MLDNHSGHTFRPIKPYMYVAYTIATSIVTVPGEWSVVRFILLDVGQNPTSVESEFCNNIQIQVTRSKKKIAKTG